MAKRNVEISAMSIPVVSIVMPCYNASRFLREAIDSVRSQSYQYWELLIVDDGSSDNSVQIVADYMGQDSRIRLIQQPNSGACAARNNGIEHAVGKYLKLLDADDILCSDCLLEQVQQMENLRSNQIPFGDYGHIDAEGNVIASYEYEKKHLDLLNQDQVYAMFCYWQILITAPLHRTNLLKKIGGFDTNLPRHQETDMHFRMALADVEFIYFPTFTFYYREYTSTYRITTNYRNVKIKEDELRREIYIPKQEVLILKKYGEMPALYRPFFTKTNFDRARYYYAHKQVEMADEFMKKAVQYGALSSFMRVYICLGKIIGYTRMEAILQLRLRVLNKV